MPNLGACGDNCDECPRGIATRKGDAKLLEETLALWIKTGLRPAGTTAESLLCHGCATVRDCANADLRECARGRHIDNCGLCGAYPCLAVKQVLAKTGAFAARCKEICSKEEFERLDKAFFSKKQNLDAMSK